MKLGKKLTPEQEARNFDREQDRKVGNEPELSTSEQNKIIQDRINRDKLRNDTAEQSHLQKFVKFNDDPLAYLHSLVAQGDFADRGKTELFTLMTLVKIEQNLKELVSVLKSRK